MLICRILVPGLKITRSNHFVVEVRVRENASLVFYLWSLSLSTALHTYSVIKSDHLAATAAFDLNLLEPDNVECTHNLRYSPIMVRKLLLIFYLFNLLLFVMEIIFVNEKQQLEKTEI